MNKKTKLKKRIFKKRFRLPDTNEIFVPFKIARDTDLEMRIQCKLNTNPLITADLMAELVMHERKDFLVKGDSVAGYRFHKFNRSGNYGYIVLEKKFKTFSELKTLGAWPKMNFSNIVNASGMYSQCNNISTSCSWPNSNFSNTTTV